MMRRNSFTIASYLIIIMLVSGCVKELSNSTKFIEGLSGDNNFELPMVNESLMIFIGKNENVYITSLRNLHSLYSGKYDKHVDFYEFLVNAINEDLLLESELKEISINPFKLNKSIIDLFQDKGVKYVIRTYCKASNVECKYYLERGLDIDLKQNINYFLFKNNFYIVQNDYSGDYVLIDKN